MKVIVQNLASEYRDEGAGAALVFLHGWQDDVRTFDALAARLSSAHRVIRLDLPGFGGSETPREAWGTAEYARFVNDFLKKIGVSSAVLIGHSFGGRVVIRGMAEGMLHAPKIVLIASPGGAARNAARKNIFLVLAKLSKMVLSVLPPAYRERARRKFYRAIGSDYATAGNMRETYKKIVAEDLSTLAAKISVPALLMWGDRDTETPRADGERLARLMPDARLEIVSGAGHFVHRENPDEVTALIKKFV